MHIYDSKYNTRRLLHSHEMEEDDGNSFDQGGRNSTPGSSSEPDESPPPDDSTKNTPPTQQPKHKCIGFRPGGNQARLFQQGGKDKVDQLKTYLNEAEQSCSKDRANFQSFIKSQITKIESLIHPDNLKGLCQKFGEKEITNNLKLEFDVIDVDVNERVTSFKENSCCKINHLSSTEEFKTILNDYWKAFRRSWITFMQQANEELDVNSRKQLRNRLDKVQKNLKEKSRNLDNVIPRGKCAKTIPELKARFNLGLATLFQEHQTLMLENFFSIRGERLSISKIAQSGSFNLKRLSDAINDGNFAQAVINMSQIPAVSISIGMQALAELERERQLNLVEEDRVEAVQRVVRQGITLPPSFRIKVNEFLVQATGQSLGDNPTDAEIERALNNSIPTALGNARNEIAEFLKSVFKRRLERIYRPTGGRESRRNFGINTSLIQAIQQLSVQEIMMARTGQPR